MCIRDRAWAARHGGVVVVERRRVALLGVYTLVRFRKQADAALAPARLSATG